LRDRRGDIPLLVAHVVERAAAELGRHAPTIPPALYQLLGAYSFPGNIRELQASVYDAVARHEGGTLSLQSFKDIIADAPATSSPAQGAEGSGTPLASLFPDRLPTFREAEDALIVEALRRADGNQGVAAGILAVSRQALNKRLRRRRSASPDDVP
jgi:DNA-binding NtrC family response regulator